jgi:hypothetical protein
MYNQSKLHLEDSIAVLDTQVFVIKQPSIPFFSNTPTYKNNNLHDKRQPDVSFHVCRCPFCSQPRWNQHTYGCPIIFSKGA